MDTMTIEELKALLDKATRGPWKWVRDHSGLGGPWRLTPGVMWPSNSEATPGGDEIDRANASLIVLAPTLAAEVIALREREARLVEALRPFSAMASEMFAANWNDDGVAISFVTKDGPMRITFKEFREAHAAHAALKEATATGRGTGTHKEERGRGDDLHQRDDLVVSRG